MKQVKPVNRIPSLLLIIIIVLSTGYTNVKKTPHIRFHSKRSHTITTINDNINMDSTIAGSMNANMCDEFLIQEYFSVLDGNDQLVI
jgi:hypothetical protein